ncbi:MAG: hydantoinase B/oxoprolinase family protein [Acidimicrobiales bacterium]
MTLQQIQRQVLWQRLIAVVEEQARTLVRSAFSTSTREAGDLSAGVFDPQGRMLAQAVTGTPGTSTRWRRRWATSWPSSPPSRWRRATCS